MEKKGIFTKILTIVGTVLVWIPILIPVFFSAIAIIKDRKFLFDYLMPAELFPATLVGGGLLIWASLRVCSHLKPVGGSLGVAVGMLIGGQVIAVVTGVATGEAESTSWWRIVVLLSIFVYSLALVALGVSGAILLRDLFKLPRSPERRKV